MDRTQAPERSITWEQNPCAPNLYAKNDADSSGQQKTTTWQLPCGDEGAVWARTLGLARTGEVC